MASLTMSGVGSGLNIGGLVDQLVAAERSAPDARIKRDTTATKTTLSALGSLSSGLSSLQSGLSALKTSESLLGRITSISDESIASVSASSTARPGNYDVEVISLASAHKLLSAPLPSTSGLGSGVLHVEVGSKSFDVTLGAAQNSPQSIVDAISAAAKAANVDVNVGLVKGSGGDTISFSATQTGAANAIRITRTSGDSTLNALVYDPGVNTQLTQRTAAADASVKIDGVSVTSATNRMTTALSGITLDLKKASPGTTVTLAVVADNSTATKNMSTMVTAYNSLIDTLGRLTAYGGTVGTSGPLIGDAMARNMESRLRTIVANNIGQAAGLGLNTSTDGKMTLDIAKLNASLSANSEATQNKIRDMAKALSDVAANYLGSGGVITQRSDALNSRLKRIDAQTANLNDRMEQVRQRYTKQFTVMDSLVGQLTSTSNFLTQSLGSVPSK